MVPLPSRTKPANAHDDNIRDSHCHHAPFLLEIEPNDVSKDVAKASSNNKDQDQSISHALDRGYSGCTLPPP